MWCGRISERRASGLAAVLAAIALGPAASAPAAATITVTPTLTGCDRSGGSVSCHRV